MRYLCLLIAMACVAAAATERRVPSFDEARMQFWRELYPNGGWTMYCGLRFENGRLENGGVVEIDHVYPMHRVYEHLHCGSRQRCRENQRYREIESDLHNMYPAWQAIMLLRNEARFGEIEGEDWRYDNCDFEKRLGVIELRPIARGNVARSLLYMRHVYGLPLEEDLALLRAWHRIDPPSAEENRRNNVIERLQGRRNPFIDNPSLADRLE